jgi:P27 family predicted phage terminase small subunit
MGKRGPKPAPTHLKILQGVEERYINRDEPTPSDRSVVVAPEMSGGAREVWDALAADLEDKGCLTPWDVYTFATFCEAVATYHDCRLLMGKEYTAQGAAGGVIKSPYHQIMRDCVETMAKIGGRFGLTPGDRANLRIDRGEDNGPKQGAERILG